MEFKVFLLILHCEFVLVPVTFAEREEMRRQNRYTLARLKKILYDIYVINFSPVFGQPGFLFIEDRNCIELNPFMQFQAPCVQLGTKVSVHSLFVRPR